MTCSVDIFIRCSALAVRDCQRDVAKRLAILIKLSRLQRLQSLREKKRKNGRKCLVRDIFKNRHSYGVFTTLFEGLSLIENLKKNRFSAVVKYG